MEVLVDWKEMGRKGRLKESILECSAMYESFC